MPTPVSRPSNYPLPFANSGAKNTIPTPATGTGKASFTEGFPAVTMMPIVAGGIPPEGKDFNGILYDITTHTVWVNAGGQYQFDAALSTAIGGYPKGMVLQNNAGTGASVSAVDNNTTDFNTTPGSIGTLWMPWAGDTLQNASIIWCGTSGGSANVQTFTPTPAVSAYVAGQTFSGIAGFTNTGSLTINISGLGAILVKKDSTTGPVPLTGGEWVTGNVVTLKYDGTYFQLTDTDLGALAMMGIGQGLEDDGSRNLRVKLADNSMRRTAAGIQSNEPVAYFTGARAITSADHMTTLVATAAGSVTVPQTTTLWNGFAFTIDAQGGNVTLTPNAADTINGGTPGAAYIVPNGTSAQFVGDGAGNITALYQTSIPGASPAPQYINSTQSITTGQYIVDRSAGSISLTIPASPTLGTSIRLIDALNTWWQNPVTLILGGGNTVMGNTGNFILDVQGADILIIYKSGNWSIQ